MYSRDVPILSDYCRQSPANMRDMLTFVLLSIRMPFGRVSQSMRDVRKNGRDSAYLWGWKQAGYDFITARQDEIFAELFDANVLVTIDYLASEVPGLAIVKGAFAAQMLGHDVACMDARNLEDLGLDARSFREFKRKDGRCTVKPATRQARIASYIQYTLESGGAEHWWNHWCNGIAPSLGTTGDEISARHVRIVTGSYPESYGTELVEIAA